MAFGVFVSFVIKAVLGDLGVLSERSERGRERRFIICGQDFLTYSKRLRAKKRSRGSLRVRFLLLDEGAFKQRVPLKKLGD